MVKQVRKRTGEIVPFNSGKITAAIEKAMRAVDEEDAKAAINLTIKIASEINGRVSEFYQGIPDVEQIQNIVEEVLSKSKFERTAKAYMLYRRSRTHARELKKFFGIKDDLKFNVNAIRVLQERYLLKDEKGRIIETPTGMFKRVAKTIARAEKNPKKYESQFFEMMKNLEFLPNSPTLMNAGTKLGQLSACFALPIEDSLESIFASLEKMALIQQSGGGTGFNFSHLRPKGDIVRSTKGVASGPVSFMKIYDEATETIKQGGKRRGANMAILSVSHPDILEFITSKQKERQLSNFNISVAANDRFLDNVEKNKNYELVNPHTGKNAGRMNAKSVFEVIARSAWQSGDPGMVFIDEINRKNQVYGLGNLEATNPCGEVPLFAYESCNLGSINLTKFVEGKQINWDGLKETVHLATRFLDDVISANKFPFKEVEEMAKGNRRIGLGIMGFAEMIALLEIPYDSKQAIEIADKLMSFINKESHLASQALAKEKGNFPNIGKSVWKGKSMRNCACTTIAPTGTISIIAGCSSGIEPLFALAFMREVLAGKHLFEANKIFQNVAIKQGFYSEDLMNKIAVYGNLHKINVPAKIKSIFKTALEIPMEQHIKIQAAFQRHTDNAVSKTINLPNSAKPEDVKKAYMLAWKLKCKGITIYRYGSKPEQVLYLGEGKKPSKVTSEFTEGACTSKTCAF